MNTLTRRRVLVGLPALAANPAAFAQARKPGEVAVGGTGCGLAPLQTLLETSKTAVGLVPNLGSGGGLKALAAGLIDVALSARDLTEAERAAGLVEREWFRTPLVWATHAGVPARNLALAALVDLYAGRHDSWSDGQPVRLVLRPDLDSDTQAVKAISPAFASALAVAAQRPGLKVAVTDDDAATDIERIPGALGTSTLALMLAQKRDVRILAIDGVVPSAATLAGRRWAWSRAVRLVTRGQPAPAPQAFVQWALAAPQAAVLARLGGLVAAAA